MAAKYLRSTAEKIFLAAFFPGVLIMYLIYKYPTWFVEESKVKETFYLFGKSTSFWYGLVYTLIVCGIALWVIYKNENPYLRNKKEGLSKYQRSKWLSIFFAQLVVFFIVPFIVPWLKEGGNFFDDPYKPTHKDAYVYVYNGFLSMGGFLYVFIVVPVLAWFFGKRYCSWFCACGNLAEAIGVTGWGKLWVRHLTPRGKTSERFEILQYLFLVFAIVFGAVMMLDAWKVVAAGSWIAAMRQFQDLVVDLMFGALIGVGAYPIIGTRTWCRYGCPLAAWMRVYGKWTKSRSVIVSNDKCCGIGHCTSVCPMGINVASYAHENRIPKKGNYGLEQTPCISCGNCIEACPVNALEFAPLFKDADKNKKSA